MATINTTTIEGLIGGEKVFTGGLDVLLNENNPLITSGLAAGGPIVDAVANGGPRKSSIPFLKPLDATSVNISTDDLNDKGDVDSLGGSEFGVVRLELNKSLGFADLQAAVTRYSAMGAAPAAFAAFWSKLYTQVAASVIRGAVSNTGLTYTSAAGMSVYEAIVRATAMAGGYQDDFKIALVGPNRYADMRVDNKIPFIPGSQTQSRFDEWGGFRLVKVDNFGDDIYVAKEGSLAFGDGVSPRMIATEIERVANGGTGGGGDILHSRRSVVIHPQGFDYAGPVAPTVLKSGTTAPQIEAKASWNKAVPDEQIGFRRVVITPSA